MGRSLAALVVVLSVGCKKSGGSATVGPSGAIVSLGDGASVAIPEGALAKNVDISISLSKPLAQASAGALSGVYKFNPEGTTFLKPVTITMPVPAGTSTASLFWTQAGSATLWDAIPAIVSATTLIAQVDHFSSGFAGGYCRKDGPCSPSNLCKTGTFSCETGTAACNPSGNEPDGTTCAPAMVCNAGT